jgi:hypothetical protein
VARACGCGMILATAGTPDKRRYLVEELGVPESCVSDSRSLAFVDDVMNATGGRGTRRSGNYAFVN